MHGIYFPIRQYFQAISPWQIKNTAIPTKNNPPAMGREAESHCASPKVSVPDTFTATKNKKDRIRYARVNIPMRFNEIVKIEIPKV